MALVFFQQRLKTFLLGLPDPVRLPLLQLRKAISPIGYAAEGRTFEFESHPLPSHGPKFSLITLVHDPHPTHFAACIESVKRQTYRNFEWVLVNNFSGDPRILAQLREVEKLPWVKVLHSMKNLGITLGTDLAAEESVGEWLAFLDHDDLLAPTALGDFIKTVVARPDVGFIYSDQDHCDEVGRRHTPYRKSGPDLSRLTQVNYICHFHGMRRAVYEKVKEVSTSLDGAQDWDRNLKVFENGIAMYHIPKILYTYRIHSRQFSAGLSPALIQAQQRAVHNHLQRVGHA